GGGPGGRDPGRCERARGGATGGGGLDHGPGRVRRHLPDAHHGAAGGGEHPVPQRTDERGDPLGPAAEGGGMGEAAAEVTVSVMPLRAIDAGETAALINRAFARYPD